MYKHTHTETSVTDSSRQKELCRMGKKKQESKRFSEERRESTDGLHISSALIRDWGENCCFHMKPQEVMGLVCVNGVWKGKYENVPEDS